MRIGIVSSGNENLYLVRMLEKYTCSYDIRYDSMYWPYGDKDFDFALERVKEGVSYLVDQGVDTVIVSPIFELALAPINSKVLPLFTHYVLHHCLSGSLVGKLGFVGTHVDISQIESLFSSLQSQYTLQDKQKATSSFYFPFALWTKEVPMWNYFLRLFSPRNYLVNKVLKLDAKYFKDAAVDTLIPLQYSYFAFEKTLQNYFNQKKTRFHGQSALVSCFAELVSQENQDFSSQQIVNIYHTGSLHMLQQQKKWMRCLEKGGKRKCVMHNL